MRPEKLGLGLSVLLLTIIGCNLKTESENQELANEACNEALYSAPVDSKYVLPFAIGMTYPTGLVNCSGSFHGVGKPDQFAFDFDLPPNEPFFAARAGRVIAVVEDQPSSGGGAGNYLLIDHGDDTFAYYLHSPYNGIHVEYGDQVEQGQLLGSTGRSGLAGYHHLHFIVVTGAPEYPYTGLPISFKNAVPNDKVLKAYSLYSAENY
jgi:murein DD-endopeptidase MepM/ murein hydrolase activator NlpD